MGTQRCARPYRRATTVATAKAVIACPDGKLLWAAENLLPPSAKVSAKFAFGSSVLGRHREMAGFRTSVRITASATASPASSAVFVIFEFFRISPAPNRATGAATIAALV